ncbi:MAG: ATP-binding cassette domain-containing protein, partial [Alphaproteobacteria bacterium]|nr:ATP-binding cassette domain-containing protein [Alphaproteobacteria bacterium]
KLLQGLYRPSEGRVLIDGADIQQFTRGELASWIGYVPQECFLFSGTLKQNIAISWPDAPDEAILRASRLAGADRFITDLPQGYATEAGEAGSKLSGGQRQRLAIARALIRDPSILLLDEVTSHLDMQAELELRLHLHELAKTRLVVVATHSMALLQACTRILVIDNAKLALDGPAAQVIARISGNAQRAEPQPGHPGAAA